MKAVKRSDKKTKIDLFVSRKVKELRTVKGVSQAELANELDISAGFIGMAESESYATRFNIQHLNEIAKILGCNPKDFLPDKPI